MPTKEFKNKIFVPTFAKSETDIQTSLAISEEIAKIGYQACLMLVIKNGLDGLIGRNKEEQYKNLKTLVPEYTEKPIIVMLSNFPLEEIDFLKNCDAAVAHIKAGIDFASEMPVGGRRIVTFHINTWIAQKKFHATPEHEWFNRFNKAIMPSLRKISEYSKSKNIEIKIETDPVPVFGDIGNDDIRRYKGVRLNELRSPFLWTHGWGFEIIRETGLGVCLDFSHNRTIYQTIQRGDPDKILPIFFLNKLKDSSLIDDLNNLQTSDIVHLNDGLGLYSKNRTTFEEGVALGEGDIENLDDKIRHLNKMKIPFVIEVRDNNFNDRVETKRSIAYLSKLG